ncbi:Alkanal monooxygenase alpha chain (plasmid) [Asticcacaulis sp. MM231]|uniref:LLM class flavin-dependent oxidoreductase n=1 Tax=Asticcacaulis sp. MM231 TaxID=3157666 RepID=UPI0032D58676
MDWSLFLINAQPPGMSATEVISNGVEYAVASEGLGFSTAWVLEHHFTQFGLVGSPLFYASFLLGRTTSLKVGTAIQVITLDHPVRLAEQVALIDQMSGGRLIFGFGRGYFLKDFVVFDKDRLKTREIADEWLRIMKSAWTTGRASADGEHVRFPEINVYPRPYTKPHPPLYTVAQTDQTIDWAARQGIPLLLPYGFSDQDILDILNRYNAFAEKAGLDPTGLPHVLTALAGVSSDGRRIKEAARERTLWWEEASERAMKFGDTLAFERYGRRPTEGTTWGGGGLFDRVNAYMANSPIGTPQECIDKLNRTVETTGIRRIALAVEGAGSKAAVLQSLRQFSEEVIPFVGDGGQVRGGRACPTETAT